MASRTSSLSKLESQPLIESHTQQQGRQWCRAMGWGVVTIIFGGVAGVGGYVISQSPGINMLQRVGAIGLVASTGLANLYALGKTFYSLRSRSAIIVSNNENGLILGNQQQILAQLSDITQKFGQLDEREPNHQQNALELIIKKLNLLEALLDLNIVEHNPNKTHLQQLREDVNGVKTLVDQLQPASPTSVVVEEFSSPSPLLPYNEEEATQDLANLRKNLMDTLNSFEINVNTHIQSPTYVKSNSGTQTPTTLTPSKFTAGDIRGSSDRLEGERMLFNPNSSGDDATSQD